MKSITITKSLKNKKLHRCLVRTTLLLIPFVFASSSVFSQNKSDIEQLSKVFEPNIQKTSYLSYMKGNSNELQFLASGFFLFYKSFISSQDGNHCVFHPSCSVYAIESIKKNGFLLGIPDAIDRLMRCNKLSPENYEKYEKTELLSDPVWNKHEKK